MGWLAKTHNYTRIQNEYDDSVAWILGVEISDYSRDHAAAICQMELREQKNIDELAILLLSPEFSPYQSVFHIFGFGTRMQALILSQVYPFEKFLVNGKPYIEWEEDGCGKLQKRDRAFA